MLRKIGNNIWVAEQALKYWGLEVGSRMTVIRLTNNELIIISPIELNKTMIDNLNVIGEVTYIIAPNLYHHLFIRKFKSIYPTAQLWVPPEFTAKIPSLAVDKVMSDGGGNILNEVDYLLFEGFRIFELTGAATLNEFVFFHRDSQTLVLTDTAFHFDGNFTFKTQWVAKLLGIYGKVTPSPLEKIASKDVDKLELAIKNILNWDFQKIIMAHGSIIKENGKNILKAGYERFLGVRL